MRNGLKFIGLAAVAALSLTAMAVQDSAVSLKRTAKVGEVTKYRMKADMEAQGQPVTFSALVVEKVTKVAENGDITVESTQQQGKVNFAGGEMEIPATGSQSTTFTSTGKVLSVTGDNVDADAYRMANLMAMQFPDKALKVGDSWESTVAKSDKGAVDAKSSYKIEAMEKVGGMDTYKIKGTFKETTGSTPASIDATYWVSVKDGNLVKAEGTWTNFPVPGMGPATMKIVLTREG